MGIIATKMINLSQDGASEVLDGNWDFSTVMSSPECRALKPRHSPCQRILKAGTGMFQISSFRS